MTTFNPEVREKSGARPEKKKGGGDGVKEIEKRKPRPGPEESSWCKDGKSKMEATDEKFVKISSQTKHLIRRQKMST